MASRGIAGDHHDAFAHALSVVARDRHGREGQVGIVEHICLTASCALSLDVIDTVDGWCAHLHDSVDEVRRADTSAPAAVRRRARRVQP